MNHGEEDISFSRITKYIAVGIKPTRLALDHLKKLGFKNVIDLNADPQEAENAHQAGISYHPAEVRDTDPIEVWLTKFDLAAGIIRRASEKSEPVYLHCTYGKGRSPTMAMAYLVSQGHTVEDAIALVKSKHPDTWSPGNPTEKYTEMLSAYAKLKKKAEHA